MMGKRLMRKRINLLNHMCKSDIQCICNRMTWLGISDLFCKWIVFKLFWLRHQEAVKKIMIKYLKSTFYKLVIRQTCLNLLVNMVYVSNILFVYLIYMGVTNMNVTYVYWIIFIVRINWAVAIWEGGGYIILPIYSGDRWSPWE